MTAAADDEPAAPRAREPRWQRVLAWLLRALIGLVGRLPAPLAYALADCCAVPWALYWTLRDRGGRDRKGYWRNVRIAFRPGGLAPARPRRHLWRWARHMTWLAVDSCRLHRIDATTLRAFCDLTEFPQLRDLHAEGHGIVFATAHIGVWDVAGYAAGLLGLPITSVFRPSPFPALDRVVSDLRTGTGQTVVAKRNVLWTLKKALARKETVGILCDSGTRGSDDFPPFLGTPAATVATPALLHLATGAPIAVVTVQRTARFRFRLRVWDVIRHAPTDDRRADVAAILQRINAGLTRGVAAAPEQWFWQSRRFKHRPPGEVTDPDGLPPVQDGAATALPFEGEAASR